VDRPTSSIPATAFVPPFPVLYEMSFLPPHTSSRVSFPDFFCRSLSLPCFKLVATVFKYLCRGPRACFLEFPTFASGCRWYFCLVFFPLGFHVLSRLVLPPYADLLFVETVVFMTTWVRGPRRRNTIPKLPFFPRFRPALISPLCYWVSRRLGRNDRFSFFYEDSRSSAIPYAFPAPVCGFSVQWRMIEGQASLSLCYPLYVPLGTSFWLILNSCVGKRVRDKALFGFLLTSFCPSSNDTSFLCRHDCRCKIGSVAFPPVLQ